jgi:hypothetical protein
MFNQPYDLTWETLGQPLTKGLSLRTRSRLVDPSALSIAENVEYPVSGGCQKRMGHSSSRVVQFPSAPVDNASATETVGQDKLFEPFNPSRVLDSLWQPGFGYYNPGGLQIFDTSGVEPSPSHGKNAMYNVSALANGTSVYTGDSIVDVLQPATNNNVALTMPILRSTASAGSKSSNQAGYQYAKNFSTGLSVSVDSTGTITTLSPDGTPITTYKLAFNPNMKAWAFAPQAGASGIPYLLVVASLPPGDGLTGNNTLTSIRFNAITGAVDSSVNSVNVFEYSPTFRSPIDVVYQGGSTIKAAAMNLDSLGVRRTTWWTIDADTNNITGGAGFSSTNTFVKGPLSIAIAPSGRVALCCARELGTDSFGKPVQYLSIELYESFNGAFIDSYTYLMSPYTTTWPNFGTGAVGTGQVVQNYKISAGFSKVKAKATSTSGEYDTLYVMASARFLPPIGLSSGFCAMHGCFRLGALTASLPNNIEFRTSKITYIPLLEVVSQAITSAASPHFIVQYHGATGSSSLSQSGKYQWEPPSAQPAQLIVDHRLKSVGIINNLTAMAGYSSVSVWPGGMSSLGLTSSSLPFPGIGKLPPTTAQDFTYNSISLDFCSRVSSTLLGPEIYIAAAQLWCYSNRQIREAQQPALSIYTKYSPFASAPERFISNVAELSTSGVSGTTSLTAPITRTLSVPINFEADRAAKVYGFPESSWLPVRVSLYATTETDPVNLYKIDNAPFTQRYAFGEILDTSTLSKVIFARPEEIYSPTHPSAAINYLAPNAAPACEGIAAIRDRLWIWGGQVPAGSVQASLLYEQGVVPAFNDYNLQVVDRETSPVVAVASMQDTVFIFKRDGIYSITSPGPDNTGQGPQWDPPRLISSASVPVEQRPAVTPAGIFFVSASGLHMLAASGQVAPVPDADPKFFLGNKSLNLRDSIVVHAKDQVRWYSPGETIVFDYRELRFSVFTIASPGSAMIDSAGTIRLARANGVVWKESSVDAPLWQDAGTPYTLKIATGWFSLAGLGGFCRVRRVGWFGEFRGDHGVQMKVYRDEEATASQTVLLDWAPSGVGAPMWGDFSWGFGSWGVGAGGAESRVWRWSCGMNRQKCSAVKFEIDDRGANSASFVPVCLAIELGKRGSMDRVRNTFQP